MFHLLNKINAKKVGMGIFFKTNGNFVAKAEWGRGLFVTKGCCG